MRHTVVRFTCFVALLLVGLPNYSAVPTGQKKEDEGTPVLIVPLRPRRCPLCSAFGGIPTATRLVVRDQDAWREVWKKINPMARPTPPPGIDFAREMLVAAAFGTVGSGGYDVVIERAFELDGQLNIVIISRHPGPRCLTPAVMGAPVDVVRLPKIDEPVVFQEVRVVNECN